ncbi:MAG: DEAD/DEAH box helicase [Deltaproteobacteria bacterium]|jgi:non-specific serine/threonine protein kinase|nr:DEAD/DEAH box helicase [Deltaproteobacteria bacterium]
MDINQPIILTPNSTLIFTDREGDWREFLFDLAALRQMAESPTTRFWQSLGELFLVSLCRWPDDLNPAELTLPNQAQLSDLALQAPPMPGAEYLSPESLSVIFSSLAQWVSGEIKGSLGDFLSLRAPNWRRVGRVTFHLAENKNDSTRPFAFMASYVTSLTSEGLDRHLPLGMALKQYSQQNDRPALISLLTPVRAAAEKLPWVAKLSQSGALFKPMSFTISMAYRFFQDIAVLEESGLFVRIPDWWSKRYKANVVVTVGENKNPVLGIEGLLDWKVNLAVGDEQLSPSEIKEILDGGNEGLLLFKGRWLEVNPERLKSALEYWQAAKDRSGDSGLSFLECMRMLAGYPKKSGSDDLDLSEVNPWVSIQAGTYLSKLLKELRAPGVFEPPSQFKADLRPYQKQGLSWLSFLSSLGLGGCLADDMGLGKTAQVLALLVLDGQRRPHLGCSILVVPSSLLANWRAEAKKFAPELRLNIWHPSETNRENLKAWEKDPDSVFSNCDLIATSYSYLIRNQEFFNKHKFRLAILDEAQAIKNPFTRQTQAVKELKAYSKLALTGTPVENRLTDLWSIFDFINPGLLGSLYDFKEAVSTMELKKTNQYAPLKKLVAPYLLRRLKSDRSVINDLPDKIETILYCHLTQAQAKLYAKVVNELTKGLEEFDPDSQGDIKRQGMVLQALTRLKQTVNHPSQLTGDGDWRADLSGKFIRLAELCSEMAQRQEKVIVFTQFKEIISPLFDHLAKIFGVPGLVLHGQTKVSERQKLVNAFEADNGPPYFILSLKAGGAGLNLTAAGQVIHFDRWWNPAVEDQATDRAYRIGQKKNVLVHKCVALGTLEEKIDLLISEKRELAGEILGSQKNKEINLVNLSDKALLRIVRLDLNRAVG